jgi:transposase
MTYSRDFRSKVLAVRKQENLSMAKVAKRFGVGLKSVLRWSKNIESITKRNKPATKIDMEALKRDVEQYPDAYQFERATRLGVSDGCVFHALKRLNITYKKNSKSPQGRSRKTLCFLRKDQET